MTTEGKPSNTPIFDAVVADLGPVPKLVLPATTATRRSGYHAKKRTNRLANEVLRDAGFITKGAS
jgi:hypothetical protein